jgi:hypothetical protein
MEVRVLSQNIVQESSLDYEDSGDFILIKDRVLLSPGNWNGLDFTKEEIEKAFQNTNWSDKQNYALIYDHDERATNWLGNVRNIRLLDDGTLVGDLEIYDKEVGIKLTKGGAKLGISAKVLGIENSDGAFVNFLFNNFSVVYEPACKKAYINLSRDEILERLSELDKRIKELEGETGYQDTKGDDETNSKNKYGKKKKKKLEDDDLDLTEDIEEDLTLLKGGLNSVNMEKEEQTQPVETVEEVKEEVVESPVEETVEDEAESKESEELSSKLDKIATLLESMDKRIAKLEEVKEEVVEEESEEKSEEEAEDNSEELSKKEEKLSAKAEPKVMSVAQLSQPKHKLLGNTYSAGEMRLAEVLLKNAQRY